MAADRDTSAYVIMAQPGRFTPPGLSGDFSPFLKCFTNSSIVDGMIVVIQVVELSMARSRPCLFSGHAPRRWCQLAIRRNRVIKGIVFNSSG